MEECICIPSYFNEDIIKCKLVSNFLKEADYINDKKININSLKKFYAKDKIRGLKLIDELKIRGFTFVVKSFNALLNTKEPSKPVEIIYTEQNNGKALKLNKDIFNYFDYSSDNINDFYFNLIPIYAFENISIANNFNYEFIKREFLRCGYELLSAADIERRIKENLNVQNDKAFIENLSGPNISRYIRMLIRENEGLEDIYKHVKLKDVLPNSTNTEKGMNSKLESINIVSIYDLKKYDIDELINFRGIGKKGLINVMQKIKIQIDLYKEKYDELLKGKFSLDKLALEAFKDYKILEISNVLYDRVIELGQDISNKHISEIQDVSYKHFDKLVVPILDKLKVDLESVCNMDDITMYNIGLYIRVIIEENDYLELPYRNKKIEDLLPSSKSIYRKASLGLKKNNIISIYDLTKYDTGKLTKIKGISNKNTTKVLEIIKTEIDLIKNKYNHLLEGVFELEDAAFNVFKDCTIGELNKFLYDNKVKLAANISDSLIKELQNVEYKCLNKSAVPALDKLNMDLESILNTNNIIKEAILNKVSDRDKWVLYERSVLGRTLEEIAVDIEVTRERVRQIEKKLLAIYNNVLANSDFIKSLTINFGNKNYFYINDFKNLLTKDNYFILGMIINDDIDDLYYFEPLNRVYFKPIDQMIKDIQKVISNLPDYGNLEEKIISIMGLFLEVIEDISYEESIKILEVYGIQLKGIYYFKDNPNKKDMLEIIYRFIHMDPLKIDEKGTKLLNEYFKEVYNVEIDYEERSWEGRTNRITEMMLVGPKTYLHLDHTPIEKQTLDIIQDVIDTELIDNRHIYADKLFNEVNKRSPGNNILSKHHIYSISKYYLSEFYRPSTGNSLRLSKNDTLRMTNSQYLYKICLEHGGIVDVETITGIVFWEKYRIERAVLNSSKLIKLGVNKCAVIDMLFEGDEKAIFTKILKDAMKKGYITTKRLYNILLLDDVMKGFIKRNNIENGKEISGLMKAVDNKIVGHNLFMYYENQEIKDIQDVVFKRYPDKVYRSQILNVLEEFKMYKNQAHYYIDQLLLEEKYVQVSREKYLNYNKFKPKDSLVRDILVLFDKIDNKRGYIVPQNHISKVREKCGDNEYEWNQYIIATILTQNGYKQLNRFNSSYEYEILVLVKEKCKYDDLSYLVYNLIKDKYDGKLHEVPVYDFLSKKGIYKEKDYDYNKKLQGDAKNNDLISVDIIGNIKLKE